uniref:Putative nucleoprotein n=1 Tax=Serpentovirinae sp. TaxID=2661817 RepID=A0A5P9K5N4_9NIDO|nr:putative nucleoprotein [Serpentovirinae sp.]
MATYYPISMSMPMQSQPALLPPRQRRRRRVRRGNVNSQNVSKQLKELTQQFSKLMPKNKDSVHYSLQASYGQEQPELLVQPTLDSDVRYRIAKSDLSKLTTDVKKRLQAGAGSITKNPNGQVTVHLQFFPPGAVGRAFIPLKHEGAETEEEV